MYFDFEDAHPETPTLTSPISRREGILLSIIAHLAFLIVVLLGPKVPFLRALVESQEEAARRAREAVLAEQRQRQPRFVFIQPRAEMPPPRMVPPRAVLSDRDRAAQAPERSPNPSNPLPFSRGNTTERVDSNAARNRPQPSEHAPAAGSAGGSAPLPEVSPGSMSVPRERTNPGTGRGRGTGVIGSALENLQRYATGEKFENLGGGAQEYGPQIQFDSKGVEFGPWIRRFVAQVKRNWFIPYAAMSLKGHVAITFYVHRDGSISELAVRGPSGVGAFDNAAYNALAWSNPTAPLPAEYPDDRAFFTVTFYYNETPPQY
jgi:TonB family protein